MNLDVVCVTHNSGEHLDACLRALPQGADVVVVDNASSDDSVAIAEATGAWVVRGDVNSGFGAACNRGARLGSAKTILFLNPDAVIDAEALERVVAALDDPSVGVVSPRLVTPDGAKQQVKWPYPSARGAWREAAGLHRLFAKVEHPQAPPADGFVIGAVFAVRREAFEAVGGFDERFWLYGEETDLCRRIADLGWGVDYVANAVATHIGGASGGDDAASSALIAEHFDRGGEHFVAKHAGRGALVSFRTANLAGSVTRGALGLGARSGLHRRRALRTAKVLGDHPMRVALDSPATRAPGKGLVVCSLEAWDDVWRRNQFFVRELMATDPDLRVLFVEPAFDVALEKRNGSGRVHRGGLRPLEADGRIVRFEPVKWLPRKVGRWADEWRDDQVLDAVRQLGFVEPRLWVNDPSYATLADRVVWPAVYDITDDWTRVADATEAGKARTNEERLFKRCEAITVCSPDLAESRGASRDDVVLIANAVDVEHLRSPAPRPEDLPEGPCAVYVGTLHTDRLDVDLVCELSRGVPGLRVVLVGPDALDAPSQDELDAAGVVRLGARPYGEVPAYLQHAAVVVIPHVVTPFTESLDPIKAYECAAVGTPTVATPVAGFRDLGDLVRIADRDEFVAAVKTVLAEAPAPMPQPVPSWADRASAFADVLAGIGEPRPAGSTTVAVPTAKRSRAGSRSSGAVPMRLVVNARFRQRTVTGVERYATELTARLPGHVQEFGPNARFAHPPMGHLWEQTRLPMLLESNDLLWSPCNTGPALVDRQVVTIHDISPTEHPEWFSPSYARWLDTLSRQLVHRARHIVTVSEFTRTRLVERLGADPTRVSVVRNGIDGRFNSIGSGPDDAQRESLRIGDRRYVLSVATFEPRKNMHAVIAAFDLVRRAHPDVELVITGNAGRKAIFADDHNRHATTGYEPKSIGYVADDDLPALYRGAEALVYVPHYEGFGLPPLEAAACGTSSVLSDIPVLHELGLPATYVDPNDIDSIAQGIIAQLDGKGPEGSEVTAHASAFSWDASANALLDVFAKLGVSV